MKKGFTLIETIIAMAILSVVLIGLYNSFMSGMRVFNTSQQQSENISKASSYLQNYLDDNTQTTNISTSTENVKVVVKVSGADTTTTIKMEQIVAKEDKVSVVYFD